MDKETISPTAVYQKI